MEALREATPPADGQALEEGSTVAEGSTVVEGSTVAEAAGNSNPG